MDPANSRSRSPICRYLFQGWLNLNLPCYGSHFAKLVWIQKFGKNLILALIVSSLLQPFLLIDGESNQNEFLLCWIKKCIPTSLLLLWRIEPISKFFVYWLFELPISHPWACWYNPKLLHINDKCIIRQLYIESNKHIYDIMSNLRWHERDYQTWKPWTHVAHHQPIQDIWVGLWRRKLRNLERWMKGDHLLALWSGPRAHQK